MMKHGLGKLGLEAAYSAEHTSPVLLDELKHCAKAARLASLLSKHGLRFHASVADNLPLPAALSSIPMATCE